MEDFGGKIRAGYKAKGWTQTQFAEAVNEEMRARGYKSGLTKASITAWCSLTPVMLAVISKLLADGETDANFFA